MRILYINHYAGSIQHGMEFRPYYLANEWQNAGHKVTIIAGDYSHLRLHNPLVKKDFDNSQVNGVSYYWIRSGKYSGNGSKRAISIFRFSAKLYYYAKHIAKLFQPNVVITSSTYPLDTYAGQKIAKLSGAKLIHEIHDMWPSTLIELANMSPNHPFVKCMAAAEKSFCRHSDEIVSMLPNTSEYLVNKGAREENIHYISNGVVLSDWATPEDIPSEHKKKFDSLKEQHKFIVGYFGGHALSNALDLLLEAASICNNQTIHFVLVGDGTEKENLIKLSNERQLTNISFLPAISKKAIPTLLDKFDIIAITGKESPLYRFGGSLNKMFDAMMAAKPIVMALQIAKNPIEICKCGTVLPDYSAQSLCKEIECFAKFPKFKLQEMGARGKSYVIQEFNYRKLSSKFSSLFS